MALLPNLGPHTDGVLIATDEAQAEDVSNTLDSLLDNSVNAVGSVDCAAGGTITVTDDVYFGSTTIKLTGAPAADFTLDIPNNDRDVKIWNTSGKVATVDTITGSSKTFPVADGNKVRLQVDGVEIELIATMSPRFHALDITALREIGPAVANEISDAPLTTATTPSLKRVNLATDKALVVEWASSNSDEVQFPTFPMPPDLDSAEDLTIHLLAKMGGGTDTPTIDVQVFDAIGDTEMGGVTAALSSTLAELSVTITAANVSGHPLGFLNISLVPGAHTTDALTLYAAWVEYVRK